VQKSTSLPPTLRFGAFELDSRTGELRKKGMKIRLQGQPVEILVMLLERPGEAITREELQKKLWPGDTFVDFDQGLNNAMKRLRGALDDDAERPHFIETVPRRGYRFIGDVNGGARNGAEPTGLAEARPEAGEEPTHHSRNGKRLVAVSLASLTVIAALLLGLNVRGWRDRLFMRSPKPQIQALAVLPLTNLSGDPEQEYFADGMTEALITELAKVSKPRVISRQSIMQYKGSKKPLKEIAQELTVDAVLEGSVERSGDRVRVTVRLQRVSPESQVWANEYSRGIGEVMALEDEIARAVTGEIQVRVTPDERIRLASSRVDPEAHDDFLRAEFLINKRGERDLQAGIAYFKKAIEKDPAYARAYAGLAWALMNLVESFNGGHRTRDVVPQAKAAAEKALELDPSLADAHVSQALVLAADWNWSEAEKEHHIALKVGPNSSDAHSSYAWYLMGMGRFDEARAQINYAGELDPVSPLNRSLLGFVALQTGQTDVAIEEFRNSGWDIGLGFAYGQKKMYPEAVAAFQRVESQWGRQPFVVASLAWACGRAGRKREARKLIDELNEIARHRYVAPALFVYAYLGLGDKETALTWVERGIEEHDQWLLLKVDPILDPLRSEPRFQAALRRMNFPL
jgi:TolB-like protein/DNA-binding winged helix-turn-helix (wHTH) protein/tetratricopeptide (TPR) repeat protein